MVSALSGVAPEVDLSKVLVVIGSVGPVQGVDVSAGGEVIHVGVCDGGSRAHPVVVNSQQLFDVRSYEERHDFGGM
eukprot:8288559-Heterocapsa_arctica.AAC.1